jgi:uncharacterized protein YdgA (DUF945 family)
MVTFSGKYYKHIKFPGFQFINSENNLHFNSNHGIQGYVWIYQKNPRVSGEIKLSEFTVTDGKNVLSIPSLIFKFDQYRAESGLWLGKAALAISEIVLSDPNGNHWNLSHIDFNGAINEASGKVSGYRTFDISRISFGDEAIGPLHLQLRITALNSQAIVNIIDAYQKIMREGELYQSQLQSKISSLLPRIFSRKSNIKLEAFDITAPQGNFQMNGQMYWPLSGSPAQDISELFQDASAQANIRVAIPLLDKLVAYASQLPYFRSVSPARHDELVNLQLNLQFANQRNYLFIIMLTNKNILSEQIAVNLLEMQKNDASLDEYYVMLQEIFLRKQISRVLSYALFWQYLDVKNHVNALEQALDSDEKTINQQLQAQFDDWVKQGYITRDKNDYVVTIQKDSSVTRVNGKDI